jgi:hypothetical protein
MAEFKTKQGPNRSLENYKELHKALAEAKGILDRLLKAQTLTEARKVLFGEKKKGAKVGQ